MHELKVIQLCVLQKIAVLQQYLLYVIITDICNTRNQCENMARAQAYHQVLLLHLVETMSIILMKKEWIYVDLKYAHASMNDITTKEAIR